MYTKLSFRTFLSISQKLRFHWIGPTPPNSSVKITMNFSIAQWLNVPVLDQTALTQLHWLPVALGRFLNLFVSQFPHL